MATVTLYPSGATTVGGEYVPAGGAATLIEAIGTSNDGKYARCDNDNATRQWELYTTYTDFSALPTSITISSIDLYVRHRADTNTATLGPAYVTSFLTNATQSSYAVILYEEDPGDGFDSFLTLSAIGAWTTYHNHITIDPFNGDIPWTRDNLITALSSPNGVYYADNGYAAVPNSKHLNYDIDYAYVVVTYTLSNFTYQLALPTDTVYQVATSAPSDYTLPVSEYVNGVFYPAGTTYSWSVTSDLTADTGWWLSVDESFAGASQVITNSRPKDPRSFEEVESFTTGSAGSMGGFPGPCCVWNNHLVYAAGGYTVGTDSPSIRIFDGRFDREVCRLPNTAAGVVPRAVMTMLSANDTIYLSTLDTGADSTDWASRVFSLDIESGNLTPIGTTFTAGHVVYALAWHMNRLWAGTNRQASTAAGKIYFFRPDIDSSWTDDYTLSTSSEAGCTSLLSYKGLLYVGCSAAAATFAKVLVRSELGVYTTSKTAAGGSATANNAILALAEFGGNLYASFYNADTPAVSLIYKFDNASWSTVYTGSSSTIVPYVGFPTDNITLLAVGGGVTFAAVLLKTTNGTSWTDVSAFLSQSSTTSAALPCFGVVMR